MRRQADAASDRTQERRQLGEWEGQAVDDAHGSKDSYSGGYACRRDWRRWGVRFTAVLHMPEGKSIDVEMRE